MFAEVLTKHVTTQQPNEIGGATRVLVLAQYLEFRQGDQGETVLGETSS